MQKSALFLSFTLSLLLMMMPLFRMASRTHHTSTTSVSRPRPAVVAPVLPGVFIVPELPADSLAPARPAAH